MLDLISATFPGATGRVRFAVACHAKTRGNAFFLKRLLESLHEDGHLRFVQGLRQWTWDLAAIESRPLTDNVVDFVADEIRRMPKSSREAIQVAACIGDCFDLETLAFVLGAERAATLENLRPGLAAELLVPASASSSRTAELDREATRVTFRFAHDRIRQAARSLIDDASAVRFHRDVGRFMFDRLEGAERERRLFELVDHMSRGFVADATRSESAQLRALNLAAARRATSSAAFEPAYRYYQKTRAHLADDAWSADYEQTLAIHLEGARAAYLSGDHGTMEALVEAAIANARTVLDRVNQRSRGEDPLTREPAALPRRRSLRGRGACGTRRATPGRRDRTRRRARGRRDPRTSPESQCPRSVGSRWPTIPASSRFSGSRTA